ECDGRQGAVERGRDHEQADRAVAAHDERGNGGADGKAGSQDQQHAAGDLGETAVLGEVVRVGDGDSVDRVGAEAVDAEEYVHDDARPRIDQHHQCTGDGGGQTEADHDQ